MLKNQRARLLGAMVEAVAQRGYAAVSVQQLVTLAGVSKRTFYEHFRGKEDCLLTTFDALSTDTIRRVAAVQAQHEDPDARLRSVLGSVLDNVARRPKETRLCLAEVFAVGPVGHERARQARGRIQAVLASSLSLGQGSLPPIAVKGMAHGLWHLISSHLFNGTLERLPALGDELCSWMASYRCASRGSLGQAPRLAATGRIIVRPFGSSSGDERRRLQRAVLHVAGRRGWSAVSRPTLCELAGVDERTFERFYGDVDDCFMEALDLQAAEALAPMLTAARRAPRSWPTATEASIVALLETLSDEPVLARAAFVEAANVGPRGIERAHRLIDGFARLLHKSTPPDLELSEAVSQAIAGAVWGVLYDYIRVGAGGRLHELAPYLSLIVLAPVIGAEAALESIEADASAPAGRALSRAM